MRRSNDAELLFNDKGQFYGVCLGADFCAEHEWGIAGLRSAFGVKEDNKKMGAEKGKTTTVPENGFGFFSLKDGALLSKFPAFWDDPVKEIIRCGGIRKKSKLECAWDEKDFAVYVDKSHEDHLKQLHVAFCENDVVFLSASQILKNGLVLAIYSSLPEELKNDLIEKDKSRRLLMKAVEKTGIFNYLEEHGFNKGFDSLGWHALRPVWEDEDKKNKSKEGIIFWLNPTHQDDNNYGWFTVEDLKQWAKGEGPIPKKNKR